MENHVPTFIESRQQLNERPIALNRVASHNDVSCFGRRHGMYKDHLVVLKERQHGCACHTESKPPAEEEEPQLTPPRLGYRFS